MKRQQRFLPSVAVFVALVGFGASAQAEDLFTGDKRLSCEALLCLSSGKRPEECQPSLSRYFGINKKKWKDTLKARKDFLNICPTASSSDDMKSLTNAIVDGAGRCDASALNGSLMVWNYKYYDKRDQQYYIRNTLPSYCSAYGANSNTDQTTGVVARYVGTPERGGYWVDADKYDAELAAYNAKLAKEPVKW